MRYAVYTGPMDGITTFTSSHATFEEAKKVIEGVNFWSNTQRAFIIEVFRPDQVVDPFAVDHFNVTPSEANKMQAKKSREAAE